MTTNSSFYNDYVLDSDTDDSITDSSEDDLEGLIQGAAMRYQKRAKRSKCKEEDVDDFEKEMNESLTEKVKSIQNRTDSTVNKGNAFYSKEYFDSDEEGGGTSTHARPSNDELLYDPNMDDADERWVNQNRHRYQVDAPQADSSTLANMPKSDAVLNCPACMTTLCRDCQRHEKYQNQYRAMFVTSCFVDITTKLSIANKNMKMHGKNKKRAQTDQSQGTTTETSQSGFTTHIDQSKTDSQSTDQSDEVYHPVFCQHCSTEVAVYDSDEVYHFFNVLTAH